MVRFRYSSVQEMLVEHLGVIDFALFTLLDERIVVYHRDLRDFRTGCINERQ